MPNQYQRRDPIERFVEKVDFTDDCWLWTSTIVPSGYGHFALEGDRNAYAHVYAWENFVGPIAPRLEVDHLCRVRHCVNPDHLEPVTPLENFLRGMSPPAINARKTHCPKGHAYNEANTYHTKDGARVCRTCCLARVAAYKARQRDAKRTHDDAHPLQRDERLIG